MKKHAKKIIIAMLVVAMLIPTVAMIYSSAATQVPVELGFNNLFLFENWATNSLSSALIKDGTVISGNNTSEGGTLSINIANGSFTMTKNDMSIQELYTAFANSSTNPELNQGYYKIDVKANTTYKFSFKLSGTTQAFVPYIFFYDSSNKCIDNFYSFINGAGEQSMDFTTPANTTHIQVRFTVSDTSTSRPGVSSVTATVDTIKLSEVVPVQSDNLFHFDDWATTLSSKIATGNATLTTDKVNNSFTITRTSGTAEIYNTFSMSSTDPAANTGLYSIEVQPNTEYSLVYTTYNTTEAALDTFFPLIFVFDKDNKYIDGQMIQGTSNGNIDKNEGSVDRAYTFRYDFTTPANAGNVQIRFTFQDPTASTTVSVKNIVFCESEIISQNNLFDYDKWLSTAGTANGGISIAHPNGTLATNAEDRSIAITTNPNPASVTLTYVDFATIDQGYAIPVEPGKTYTITYNLDFGSCVGITAFTEVRIFTAWYNSEKTFKGYANYFPSNIANKGENTISFTVPAGYYYIELAFANYKPVAGSKVVLNNVEMYETDISSYGLFEETGEKPEDIHRQAYTYEGNGETYGTLPVPSEIPDGYVFAGWYTGENGTGNLITKDTPIHYDSLTVYPKFEPAVDSLSIATMPTRVTYTVGEKFNPAGLVLNANIGGNTISVASGYRCSPEYLNTAGQQTITVEYGGKSVTFQVTVNSHDESSITVNGTAQSVQVANNKYTIDYTAPAAFNRYEITYYSDSYVKAIITFDGPDGDIEEFFLEPSDNGSFASYIDNFLKGQSHYGVMTIEFTCLNKKYGNFELYSLNTISTDVPSSTVQYFENDKYKVGIDLSFGGVISYIECLEGSTASNNTVMAAQYRDSDNNVYTKVDYKDKLPAGAIATVESVNLINTNDKGRFLQQSYYGTDQAPFVMGDYNGTPWKYNPVQGGNLDSIITDNGGESSKVIDYRITHNQIYVKTRPLDWGKNSIDYGQNKNDPAWNTPSYMEAWYTFTTSDSDLGAGLIQGTCRFVDYSGYPSTVSDQEFPAFYTIEPLNHYVYNNVTADNAWEATQTQFKNDSYSSDTTTTGAQNIEEPEFWGINPNYAKYAPNGKNVDVDVDCYENWAAFTASEDKDSFGIGVYSPGVTDFTYGCFLPKYMESQYNAAGEYGNTEDGEYVKAMKAGTLSSYKHIANYRHAQTLNPSAELHTSYIAPVNKLTFESYTPITYTYYVSTGTADEIREDFRLAKSNEENAEKDVTKIAVPETVYLNPANNKDGQYYVNNIINGYNMLETVAESDDNMYFGLYALDAKQFTVKVSNVTNPSDDIELYSLSSGANVEGETIQYTAGKTYIADNTYGLRFKTTGLSHGEIATAKWEITVTLNDNTTQTYTAYTVLYAPERTVGAVAEARQVSASQHELSSWITGANGVDHTKRAPLGSFKGDYRNSGYFREDPLVYTDPPSGGSDGTAYDYILGYGTANGSSDDYHENAYVMQTATNDHDSSRSQSYLGLLTIDKSRYSNTNQIPNLKIGYDVLRIGSYAKNSLGKYNTYYTLGTESAYTSTDTSAAPSGWTTYSSYTDISTQKDIPYRESFVPSYTVNDSIDGQYIHAVAQGKADQTINTNQYATAGTSVLIDITDKSALRDAVLDGYSKLDGTPLFNEKLENAATVLGDPTATQEEIDNAKKELSDALMFALKYDNLFSSLEFSQHSGNQAVVGGGNVSYGNNTIIIKNGTITNGETYTEYSSSNNYYKIALNPNTEYVFEYDVTTTVESQAFLFFYNSSNASSEPATNIQVKTGNGSWTAKTESSAHIGNYQKSSGTAHYAIKFTTGATTTQVGFRFGNTTNSPCESTFSNIKLIDSARYYEDATYSMTEDEYAKGDSYGSLITPVRPGYTFVKWVDAAGNTVAGSTVATNHLSVYSVWTANTYTITYNANGGSVSPATQTYTTDTSVTIPTPAQSGYLFTGWKVTASDGSWKVNDMYQAVAVPAGMYGNATLTAQWSVNKLTAYFDTILDFSEWNTTSASNATFSNVTDNGFTLTSNSGAGEGTSESPLFPVTVGKQYKVDIDITGSNWDVYVFFYDNNSSSGLGIDFNDSANRFSSNGSGNQTQTFTAPSGATRAVIRLDANGSNNAVTFSDIRVYEANTCAPNVDVPYSSKEVTYGSTFGTLPTPTREGYTFKGWYDGDTLITAGSKVTQTSNVYLKSTWVINDSALVSESVVIDFATPAVFAPFTNDTIFNAETGTKAIVGFSKDGVNPANTLAGDYGTFSFSGTDVTYTPSAVVNGIEDIYYHASLTVDGVETVIKNKITVAPASNILYEENMFTAVAVGNNAAWNTVSVDKVAANKAQSNDNVYGYDSNTEGYNRALNYSNGSAYNVTVSSTNKSSQIMKFTFTGTGFDLNGVCGPTTGVFVVSIKNEATGKFLPAYIVDTYYSDSKFITETNKNLYQVPIIHETSLEYGTYTIQVASSYLPTHSGAIKNPNHVATQSVEGMTVNTASVYADEVLRATLTEMGMEEALETGEIQLVWFDENSVLNGGMGVNTPAEDTLQTAATIEIPLDNYIDSVRVYNPIQNGNDYYIASEQNAVYYNVIGNLLSNNVLTGEKIFAYISGNSYVEGTDTYDITLESYEEHGPKDELYLAKSDKTTAVAFKIKDYVKDSVRVMISLRAAYGTPEVKIGEYEFDVLSNTEMYYDITDYIGTDGTVTIQNQTAGTLLSIGSLKITSESLAGASISSEVDLEVARAMMFAVARDVEPNTPVVPDEPEDTTTPDEPADDNNGTTDEPTNDNNGTTDEPADDNGTSEEPAEDESTADDSDECWLIRFFKWLIGVFVNIFNFVKGILGF